MMKDLGGQVFLEIRKSSGLTDREITNRLFGEKARVQAVNRTAHLLMKMGLVERRPRPDGRVGNFVAGKGAGLLAREYDQEFTSVHGNRLVQMSEFEVKRKVRKWLETDGWSVEVGEGADRDFDIEAKRGGDRWVVGAKGSGSRNEMKKSHFFTVLGETLQRMQDPEVRYSIALPDIRKFRRLWERLPVLAKSRTGISVLFVREDGSIDQNS